MNELPLDTNVHTLRSRRASAAPPPEDVAPNPKRSAMDPPEPRDPPPPHSRERSTAPPAAANAASSSSRSDSFSSSSRNPSADDDAPEPANAPSSSAPSPPNRRLHLGVPARRGSVVETQLEREVQVQVRRGRDAVPEDPDARARRRVRRESRDTAVVVVVAAAAAGIIRRSAARPAAARRDARLSLGGGRANRLQSALGGRRRSPDAIRIRLAAARMRIVGRRPGARLGPRGGERRGSSERARRDGEGHGEPRRVEGLLVGVLQFFRTRTRAAFLLPGSLREERRQRSELRVGGLERVRVRDGGRERFGEDVDDVGERLGG